MAKIKVTTPVVDIDGDDFHARVSLLIVRSVDEDFIENLVHRGNEAHVFFDEFHRGAR